MATNTDRRARARRGAGALIVTCGLTMALGGGQAAAHGADGEWRLEQPLTDTASRVFYDVAATGPGDAWTVGFHPDGPAIRHWDGKAWTDVAPGGTGGKHAQLQHVAAAAPDDAWAAGVLPAGNANRAAGAPLVLQHWDGARWANLRRPAPPSGWSQFPGDIAAFGRDSAWLTVLDWKQSTDERAYHVERWDGTSWQRVELPPAPAGTQARPHGISGTGPDDVWITVDAVGKNNSATPLLYHWDGTAWQRLQPPVPAEHKTGWLATRVVATAENSVYVLGKTNVADPQVPKNMAAHWDGSRWRQLPAMPVIEANAAGADGDGTLWVGGYPKGQRHSVLARWDGKAWATRALPPEVAEQGAQSSVLGMSPVPGTPGILTSGLVSDAQLEHTWGVLASHGLR